MWRLARFNRLLSLVRPSRIVERRFTSSTPPPAISGPPPPENFSGRVVGFLFDHPWRVFGPLGAALVVYLIRTSIATARQETLVRCMDEVSPLHSREVAALGRANALSAAEWRVVVSYVLASVEERCVAVAQTKSNLNYADASRMKPSEIETAVLAAISNRRQSLSQLHMLRRAAAWLAACEAGAVAWPADDAEAHTVLSTLSTEAAQASGLAEPEPEGIFGTCYFIALGLARTAGFVEPGPTLPQPGGVREPREPRGSQWDDAPLPVLIALSLYGCLVGGRDEYDADTPEADEAALGKPRPSERILLWADMLRDEAKLRARLGVQVAVQVAGLVSSQETDEDGAEILVRGSASVAAAGLANESACAPLLTIREAAAVVKILADTFQLPTRARTGKVEAWPSPRFTLRSSDDIVAAGCKVAEVDFTKTPTPSKPPPPIGGVAPTPAKPAVSLSPQESPRRWLSGPEVRSALLNSREVCAWGECTRRVEEYKGGLF